MESYRGPKCQGQGLGQNEGDGGQKGGAGPLVYWGGGIFLVW